MQFLFYFQLIFLHCFESLLSLILCSLACIHAVLLDDFCYIHSKFVSPGSFFYYDPCIVVRSNQNKVSASSETSFCHQLSTSYSCNKCQGHEPSGTWGILTGLASGCQFLRLTSQSTLCCPSLKIYQSDLNTAQLHC